MNPRPTLLFVTPAAPARAGNGLAMRAGAVLAALTRHYEVTLALVPLYGGRDDAIPAALRSARGRVVRLGESSPLDRSECFDVVHLFRLAVVSAAAPWLERAGACHLDLMGEGLYVALRRCFSRLPRLPRLGALARWRWLSCDCGRLW